MKYSSKRFFPEDGDWEIINGIKYVYVSSYDRMELPDFDDGTRYRPAIACPQCFGTKFSISYGDWECIAHCECGHSMTIYDG